jgi:hypothetical protein
LGKVKFVSVLSWKPRRGDVWGKEVWLHAFFISALDGGGLSASIPGRFAAGEGTSSALWMGGMGGYRSRFGCGGEEENFRPSPGIEPRRL